MDSTEGDTHIPQGTYEALPRAAYRALCERGYDDLTMRDVAAAFEKSRGLIPSHYDTRADLSAAVFEWTVDQYERRLRAEVRGEDSGGTLGAFVAVALYGPADDEFDRRTVDLVRTIIEDGIERGAFRGVDAEAAHFPLLTTDAD